MSLQYRWNYLSGRIDTDLGRFWEEGSLTGTVDPTVPNLPLNSPAVAGSYTLTATTQTYSAAPVSTILKASRKLVATQQTYSASTVSTILKVGRRLAATLQTYAVAVPSSVLRKGSKAAATVQSYSVASTSTTLTYVPAVSNTKIYIIT